MRPISFTNIILLTIALLGMFSLGLGFTQYLAQEQPNTTTRLVCFSFNGQLRINMVENNIRFEDNVIAFSNSKGTYRIYPPDGYICSIVTEAKELPE